MYDRWLKDFSYDTVVPDIPLTGENGTLKVGIYGYAPLTFAGKNSEWQGFDIEQFTRFAASLGMNVEFTDMSFTGLLAYVASGKADFGSSAYITPERAEQVIFSEPNAQSGTVVVTKKVLALEPADETVFNFIEWVKKGIQNNLITENRYKMVINGLGVTLQISFLSQLFGTVLGAVCAYLLTRKAKLPRFAVNVYSGLIHGTPMVVLLMISYYIVFSKSNINSLIIAVAAFTLVEGAAIGDKLHMAISTVDPTEIEAARSMGYPATKAFMRVTLPQAIKVALPGYLNGFVELVKATAIVGYIAIQDLSRAGDIIRSRTYDAYFPLLFVALIYLVVTTLCVQLFKFIIRRAAK
jgi:polar amino acid transport system substrate-binding protein